MKLALLNRAAAGIWVAMASTAALAQNPFDPITSVSLYGRMEGQSTTHSEDTFETIGAASFFGSMRTSGSISAGPLVTTRVDMLGWNDTVPGYDPYTYYHGVGGQAAGQLNYTFIVNGPTAMSVPVTVSGSILMGYAATAGPSGGSDAYVQATGSVSANASPGSTAYYTFTSGESYSAMCDANDVATCNTNFTLHLNVNSGSEWGYIQMYAGVTVSGSYFGPSSAYSTVDPLVQIDPDFLAANPGYSLVFPEGLANQAAPVPEPSAALLLATGLAAVGAMAGLMKRRRQSA